MYPVHGYMEPHHGPCSLSHQIDQNSHPYHHTMPMRYNAMSMNNPPDYNACCNKSYPYGYQAFRPPYSNYQPPPQFYYPGPYPPYPDHPYYNPYFIPPPPRNNHCCGCPNYACHQRENDGVKIVEQSPEPEQKKSSGLPSYPYPVVWIPPGHQRENNEVKIVEQSPEPEQKKSSDLSNYPYPVVWFPPGYLNEKTMNNLKDLVHGGEEKKKTQPSWPIIWMPGNEKPEEKVKELKEINAAPKSGEEPPKFKIIPLKFLENGNEKENKENNRVRSIPVKQVEEMPEMQRQVDNDKKSSVVETLMEEEEVKKSNSDKRTSPAKSSKLPPICLRVDPLPRKKGSNGSSRSPSPPAIKETKKENEKKDIKVVEIKDKSPNNAERVPEKVVSDDKKVHGKSSEDENVKKITEEASDCKKSEVRKITKSLSESEAAVLIQCAYRGYEVRRTQVLEKLRKIARVRERIADVRTQIHQFEASQERDSKQRAVISETVMNLLLQLDTIQGLHPDVREIRKSVARELVCLQEKLDALGIAKSNGSDEVEKQSKDEALESQMPSVAVIDGEKHEKVTEDERKSGAEMTAPLEHGDSSDFSTTSDDSKMVEESQLISDRQETVSLDDKIAASFDPQVSPLRSEENEDRATIVQAEPIESANESSKELDMQPEHTEQKPKLEEDRLPCIVDAVEKIMADTSTTSPEIVPAQSESAEVSQKLKLHDNGNENKISVMRCNEDMTADAAAFAEGDKIEKIAEEISAEKLRLEESDGEKSVSAEGYEIAKIAEESATILTTDIDPTLSETSEISEEKPDNNQESSSIMPAITADEAHKIEKIAAESATATTLDIAPTQSEHAALSEEKLASTEESSLIMPLISVEGEGKIENVAEDSAAMESDIVPTQSEHTEISEGKPDFNEESSSIMQSIAAEGDKIEHIAEESAAILTRDIVPAKNESSDNHVVNVQVAFSEEKRLLEENQKLREMLEKLFEAGKEQLEVISTLNGRVKNLEKKIISSQKKKPRVKRSRISKPSAYFPGNNNTQSSAA
ncbi:putative IQ motif, EF-hand binding, BAG domain, BAG domain superfamily [Dioscorea sansibarensis]